jgi:thiopeptide-type bacteriocin biosynthesis protein
LDGHPYVIPYRSVMSEETTRSPFAPSGFFVVRTPLLPAEELERWGEGLEVPETGDDPEALAAAVEADRKRLRARLHELLERPEIREALFVASPSLFDEGLPGWRKKPDGKSGLRAERALVRYAVRMIARCTPFGLFSGCSVGTLPVGTGADDSEAGDSADSSDGSDGADGGARIHLRPRASYRRHTRFDMDYLFALAEDLAGDEALRRELLYLANSSLYRAAGRWRYAEARLDDKLRTYHLVAVESSPYLDATLERARSGARLAELAGALADDDPEVTVEEAEEFLAELVDAQLLVPDLAPRVTGGEAVEDLTEVLEETEGGKEAAASLTRAETVLRELDEAGLGNDPERYRQVGKTLGEELPTEVEIARLFQVDMIKPAAEAALTGPVLDELNAGVDLLLRLRGSLNEEGLDRFRREFTERYGDRTEVPLTEALDEETGIGFTSARGALAEASPLLAGLPIAVPGDDPQTPWGPRQALLLTRLEEAVRRGEQEIALTDDEVKRLSVEEPAPLPEAFHVMASVAAASEEDLANGDFRMHIKGVGGPSGARLLGRFCHADSELRRATEKHLRQEEALVSDAVFAEIVHLPQGRIGNVLARPVMRAWEIPFLGRPMVDPEHRIPVDDLRVSVIGPRILLTSQRLGKEVIPRLTTAHNFVTRSLGVYRFLCTLQSQGSVPGLAWSWGPLDVAPFLPRVTRGKLVLSRARWRIPAKEIEELEKKRGAERLTAVREWRERHRLPRHAVLAEADNELWVDFENVLSLEAFLDGAKGRGDALLKEHFPDADELWVQGPEGRFYHELLVPCVRTTPPRPAAVPPRREATVEPYLAPGSEWLYVKLYSGTATADGVLREVVAPVAREALETGAADRWFFIRYGDPEWHLRVRFHGEPAVLHQQVLPRLEAAAAPLLEDGRLWKVQLDTYQREIGRYGGPEGIEPAEQLFWADSEAVLGIVMLIEGDEGADARWRLAVAGLDRLFTVLGLDLEAKIRVAERLRESFTREFKASLSLKKQIGDRHRKERKPLEELLAASPDGEHPLAPGLEALERGARLAAPAAQELRKREKEKRLTASVEDLATSFAHMHVNRLIRSEGRAHELVLYEFLYRHYNAQAARARAMEKAKKKGSKGKKKKASQKG